MKKLLSCLLTAAMLVSSFAIPALADYEAADYDKELVSINYDSDGTVDNSIDHTKAKAFTDQARVFTLDDTLTMNKETFISFDFCIAAADAETAYMQIRGGEVGPQFTYNGTQLRNQRGSGTNDYDNLGAITTDTWYTAELEGRTNAPGGDGVKFRLYGYTDGEKTIIQESSLNMRRYWANSGRNDAPYYMEAKNISIDNVKVVQEYPDEIQVTGLQTEINAGAGSLFDYKMFRKDVEVTKYGSGEIAKYGLGSVTWSLEGNDETVSIDQSGQLTSQLDTPTQTVTVKVTSTFNGEELSGSTQLKINGVDLSEEKFTEITITGDNDTIKGGETLEFTATTNATAALEDGDIVWSIYNYNNIFPNNNKAISIDDGVLSVEKGVIPQDIYIRASGKSGNVVDSKKITITWSDDETRVYSNACEETIATAESVDSCDGSKAYKTTAGTTFTFTDQSAYTAVEMDIQFIDAGSGFVLKRADGTENSSFYFRDDAIKQQTGSSSWSTTVLPQATANKWYHLEILYWADEFEGSDTTRAGDGSINIYEYTEEGAKELLQTTSDINRRNRKNIGRIDFTGGVVFDNVKVTLAAANDITLKAAKTTMFPTETNQITATFTRNGLTIKSASGVEWSVLDSAGLPIIDNSVTIDDNGLLTASSNAAEGKIKVQAKTAAATATVDVEIKSSDFFTVTNIGINEAGDKVVKLYAEKNLAYDDNVTFVIAFYDENNRLLGTGVLNGYGSTYSIGENQITVDWKIPEGFNKDTGKAKVYVWTRF